MRGYFQVKLLEVRHIHRSKQNELVSTLVLLGNEEFLQPILRYPPRSTGRPLALAMIVSLISIEQVNNVRRPGDFETAVKDKEAAKENIKVSRLEGREREWACPALSLRSPKMNDLNS